MRRTSLATLAVIAAFGLAAPAQAESMSNKVDRNVDSVAEWLTKQPTEANPNRIDASQDHGPTRNSGSRLKYPIDKRER
jgi:hypothetical protein